MGSDSPANNESVPVALANAYKGATNTIAVLLERAFERMQPGQAADVREHLRTGAAVRAVVTLRGEQPGISFELEVDDQWRPFYEMSAVGGRLTSGMQLQ